MKSTKLTAALLAAATAIAPFSFNTPSLLTPPTVFAEDSGALTTLPEWIPTDFDSATDFRNTYGATHIENGLICIVYPERVKKGSKNGTFGYKLQPSFNMGQTLKQEIYTHEHSETCFNVFVYQPQKQGDLALQIVDPHAISDEGDKPVEPPLILAYSFSVDNGLSITETDIYSWLPDSKTEYNEYMKQHGEVSIKDNYVVFCTMTIDQFGDKWEADSTNKYENIIYLQSSDCTMQVPDLYDDGSVDIIYVYQAKKDGYEKLSWTRTSNRRPEQDAPTTYTLTADCAILDDAQTILLPGQMRTTLIDYDTGKKIALTEGKTPSIWTNISNGGVSTGPILMMETNPAIVDNDLGKSVGSGHFSFGLDQDHLPDGYIFPGNDSRPGYYSGTIIPKDHLTVTKYDNGAADIIFKLTQNPAILSKDTIRFTFVDAETGEPVQNTGDADAYLFGASLSYFPNGESNPRYIGENISIGTEPYIWDVELHASAGMRLNDINDFSFHAVTLPDGCELDTDGIKTTLYEHNAMDVIVPLKFTLKGDVNKDGTFNTDDVILLKKWLSAEADTKLGDWKAADFNSDNLLNAVDLSMMKQELLKQAVKAYVEPDVFYEWGMMFIVQGSLKDELKLYTGPAESYEVITSIPAGTRLMEKGYQSGCNEWIFTEYNGQYGWIRTVGDDGETSIIYYEVAPAKPVIYLYPEQETDIHIELELTESELNTTYPKYNNGWDVTAFPDGTLLNKSDGSHHRYLFWDAVNCRTRFDFSRGFCIAGDDTERFLKDKLTYMGLTEDEMNELLVYWLPLMEHHAYNLIAFQSDAYTESAKLTVTPAPDSECRIFMAYVPLEEAVEIEPQQLEPFERTGFAVVEWGGVEIRQ